MGSGKIPDKPISSGKKELKQIQTEAKKLGFTIKTKDKEGIKEAKKRFYEKHISDQKTDLMEINPRKITREQADRLYAIFKKWNEGVNSGLPINKDFFIKNLPRYTKLLNRIYFGSEDYKITSELAALLARIETGEFENLHSLGGKNPYTKKNKDGDNLYEEVRVFGIDSTIFVDCMNITEGMRPWASFSSSRNSLKKIRWDAHKCIEYAQGASRVYGVDPNLVLAVIRKESIFDTQALSPAGAAGLMQLMPETGEKFGVNRKLRITNPELNVKGGTQYLKHLFGYFKEHDEKNPKAEKLYSLDNVVASYNAGEDAVVENSGVPPYIETREYVPWVKAFYRAYKETGYFQWY